MSELSLREFLKQESQTTQLRALRKPCLWRFLAAVAFNYVLIALAIGIAQQSLVLLYYGHQGAAATISGPAGSGPAGSGLAGSGLAGSGLARSLLVIAYGVLLFLSLALIAARQHALLVLMHEGAHRSISRNRILNDTLSDMLCGAPLLANTRSYRRAHLAHHQHLNGPNDPDWCRKVENTQERDQWLFPTRKPLWQLLIGLYGHSVTYLLKSLADLQRTEPLLPSRVPSRASSNTSSSEISASSSAQSEVPSDITLATCRYLHYAVAGIALTLTSSWPGFLMFWLAPMLLVLPLIMRIRSIAEHFAVRHDHPLRQTRSVRAGWLERLFLAPHNIGLHIDHHLQASVPFYQLPRLHQLLLKSTDYRDNAHLNDGYFVHGAQNRLFSVAGKQALFAADLYGPSSKALQPSAEPASLTIQTASK